jgi:tetratricopeptide (TPR) repeat protein
MPHPTVFLSAATVDLKEWRDVLDGAFRRGGFRVLTQDKSLRSAPGDVKRLLVETIADSDCIIHLAGLGYGSDATDPFPGHPGFQCSWTQFEYYHGHFDQKGVIAFVCAPPLSQPGFVEKGVDAADVARKQRLQSEHRERVQRGTFDNTPLQSTHDNRTCNETVDSVASLLTAVAAAVGTLHQLDRTACEKAQQELTNLAEVVGRIEAGVESANVKLDRILALLRGPTLRAIPRQLPIAASKYFGRAAQLADLKTRLRDHKRTDVWGGPGMGKTALAAEAVAAVVGDDPADLAASPFPQGVVFLDLYRHHDLQSAWQALASAFDDSLPTDMPAQVRATRACAQRQALIILEGAEELRDQLETFISVIATESTLLVLTREESQTAAARRIKLDEVLKKSDALALLRHLAGKSVPKEILAAVQERLGGHPLALTWAGSQLGDATQPPKNFLRDLQASPLTKLTEPGGDPQHTLRWMFDRSVRLMAPTTRTVLAAVSRISEPFDEAWAEVAGGSEADLQRLVQLSFLTLSGDQTGWQFDHALAAQFARELPLPNGLLAQLGQQAITGIATADARCQQEGPDPLGLALAHVTSLLEHDGEDRVLRSLVIAIVYHHESDPVGIRRGRLDFALSAVQSFQRWLDRASTTEKATPAWQRELSVSLNKLGELATAQGNLPEAQRLFGEDLRIAQRLAESDPANAEWQRDLSVSLNKLGELAVAQGNLPEAQRLFGEALLIRQRLAESDPANAQWQRDLFYSYCVLAAKIFMPQERWSEALPLLEQSLAIAERLAASDPTNVMWQKDVQATRPLVAEVRGKLSP